MSNSTSQFKKRGTTTGHAVVPTAAEQAQTVLSKWFKALQLTQMDARTLRFTAQGGSADVRVQLEVLQPSLADDARQRELFYLEAFAAAKLTHFNIARTSKPQETEGLHFCVIEYKSEMCRLRDRLSRNGWLEVDAACDIADQVASALDCAHSSGVLHLQLSPACIWIEPNGWTTVAGFGIERAPQLAWAHRERARRLAATYASVEQASSAACDERSDLYSLGAILYEMLTDRVPFDSDDAEYVRERQLQFTPAPPHLISPELPEAISVVIMKLLEKEKENRFASAAEFQVALDEARQTLKG
ncbi:MAG: serine/threonine-protein kinase [Blastocatellia bacterium]